MKQEENGSNKRVSFLMPYIDFCFMLIIIFAGMLSIAYFEPLGRTDIQTRQATTITNREGQFDTKPLGVQWESLAPGDLDDSEQIRPMRGGETTPPATTAAVRPLRDLSKPSGADPEELEKLKEQLRLKEEELKKMSETQHAAADGKEPDGTTASPAPPSTPDEPGSGNHHYIDLRKKNNH